MINVPGCCHVRSYEYVNLWKCFGPLKKHDPSTVSACVGANSRHPEICMVWHFCRWSQTLLPKRELKFSSVFLATRRPGMWTLPFPVDNILSEMCRVTFLLGWWTSSRSKKCGKSSRRIPLDILTQDNILGLNSHILEGLKSQKIYNVSSIDRCFLSDQSVGVSPLLVEALSLGTFSCFLLSVSFGNSLLGVLKLEGLLRRNTWWIISQCHWHMFLHVRCEMGVS